jgi:type I protein arginine methyltransferase
MLNHLETNSNGLAKDAKFPWDDDVYLKPYLEDDPLLHSLSMDDDGDDDIYVDTTDDKLMNKQEITEQNNRPNFEKLEDHFRKLMENGVGDEVSKESDLKVVRKDTAARERKDVDEDYFGSYSSFGIHREMLDDKVCYSSVGKCLLLFFKLLWKKHIMY